MTGEKIQTAMNYFNSASVSIKNVFWYFAIVIAVAFFYFNSDEHMNDDEIHMSPEKQALIIEKFQQLRDRIEVLEWELKQLELLTKRRHEKQADDIDMFNKKHENYENKLVEVRKIILEAFIKDLTDR